MRFPQLLEFDQGEFFSHHPSLVDMDTTGYVYVPSNCQHNNDVGERCETCKRRVLYYANVALYVCQPAVYTLPSMAVMKEGLPGSRD